MTTLLDPTAETTAAARERLPRPAALDGLTIGLLDINKSLGDLFLDRVEELLQERNLRTARYRKPTFTKVMPAALARQIAAECDVLIEALAD